MYVTLTEDDIVVLKVVIPAGVQPHGAPEDIEYLVVLEGETDTYNVLSPLGWDEVDQRGVLWRGSFASCVKNLVESLAE